MEVGIQNVVTWDNPQVLKWLENLFINDTLKFIKHVFKEHMINGEDLVELTDQELKDDVGVKVINDRK